MVVLVIAVTLALIAVVWIGIARLPSFRHVPLGWRLLSLSSLAFVAGGVMFIASWQPTPGPYGIGGTYPFGSELKTWEVSMGFAMIAFGLLHGATSLLAARIRSRWFWGLLLLSWLIFWFPHGLIGVAFMAAGSETSGAVVGLGADLLVAAIGLMYLVMVAVGFVLTLRHEGECSVISRG